MQEWRQLSRDHSHYVTRPVFDAMPVPKARVRSASKGKSGGGGSKGKGKGGRSTPAKNKSGAQARASSRTLKISTQYCFTYYRTGKCDKENCFPHLTKEEVHAQAAAEGVPVPE